LYRNKKPRNRFYCFFGGLLVGFKGWNRETHQKIASSPKIDLKRLVERFKTVCAKTRPVVARRRSPKLTNGFAPYQTAFCNPWDF
jgi:hypothetical protein